MTPNRTKKTSEVIRKFALLNALGHDGEARVQPVLGKLFAEHPDLRAKIKEIGSIVAKVVKEVNKLSLNEQKVMVEKNWPELLVEDRVQEDRVLPQLPNVEKYDRVITRFSPNPDCVLHLGSARAIILSHEYAKMYEGVFYLRFEDTDPKMKKPRLEFYDSIRNDLAWLGCKWDAEYIQSDRLPIYYEQAKNLLKMGHAYVCTCKPEDFREKVKARKPCPCRNSASNEHLLRWERMLDGTYEEGEAVVRIKTDLDHPNPAVRDWPALRIIDTKKCPHPRVKSKYRVWPLYNFASGIDDHLMGITHIIRGKEHLTNKVRQEYMYRHLGWEYPEALQYGRLKITGASLSKSVILQGLRNGIFKNWDDPRLATLGALKKRGITREAIQRLVIDIGPKAADVMLSWENLYAHNRKIIDPTTNRYFFVKDPKRLRVKNIPHAFTAQVPLHPDHPERGYRSFEIKPTGGEASFLVSSGDTAVLRKERHVRFMSLFNFQITKFGKSLFEGIFHSESYEEAKKLGAILIHWIPTDTGIPCKVVMPNASVAYGLAENDCERLHANEIVQFERFGFVRVDNIDRGLTAYFAHR